MSKLKGKKINKNLVVMLVLLFILGYWAHREFGIGWYVGLGHGMMMAVIVFALVESK